MSVVKMLLVFALGITVGLVSRLNNGKHQLTTRALERQAALTAASRQEFAAKPDYIAARRLALHLSWQRSLEKQALEDGATVPHPTPHAEALDAAFSAERLARTGEEREEAARLVVRAEQLGL